MYGVDGYLSRLSVGVDPALYCATLAPSTFGFWIFGDSFMQQYTVRHVTNHTATVSPQICFAPSAGCPNALPPYPVPSSSSSSTAVAASAATGPVLTGSLCWLTYSLPGNVDYPFSVATSLSFSYNVTSQGSAVQVLSGFGQRTYSNHFGHSTSISVTVAPPNSGGNDNLLYLGTSVPLDGFGLTLLPASPVQLPGAGPPRPEPVHPP